MGKSRERLYIIRRGKRNWVIQYVDAEGNYWEPRQRFPDREEARQALREHKELERHDKRMRETYED